MSIALVNQTYSVTASGGSTTKVVTIPAPTTGNTLIVQIANVALSTLISSISQNATPFTKQASQYNAGNNFLETWSLANCGTSTTINIVVSSTYNVTQVLVSEWSGMPAAIALDGSAGNADTASTVTTSTITPTASGPVVVLAQGISTSHSLTGTPGNGFTEFTDGSGAVNKGAFAYKILSAGAAIATSWPKSASYGTCDLLICGFDGTGAAGGSPQPTPYYHRMLGRAA